MILCEQQIFDYLVSFCLFRFFDIVKPFPINLVDRHLKNKKDKKETIEGEKTANAAVLISKKYQLDLPIIKTVNRLIIEDIDTKEAIKKLLERPLKKEY